MPMRQLRNCDFCGEDAAGIYEAIPPELSPTEAEQRRVVLCADCLETLETVVDPLLSRLGVDRDADSAPTAEPTPDADFSPSDAVDAEKSHTAESAGESDPSTPSDSPSRAVPTSGFNAPEGFTDIAEYDGFQEPDEAEETPSEAGVEAERTRVRDGDVAADGVATSSGGEADRVDTPGGGTDGRDAPARDPTAPGSDPSREEPPRGTPPSPGGSGVGEEPEDFRTVMRLLGNREFPVERSAVVELAGSAYQLDDAQVDRILDHAVDRGVLTDEDGTLRKD
ncbi:ICP22 family protein [Halobellus captivus]|uniref:hypothetical protein n=1 Tax=Halobellus captivus TaxID=2592614 RepID=UPI00119DC1AB|nr:hypothetical protein [Halobellus captivus]